jgi:error-prone DNA polymerase
MSIEDERDNVNPVVWPSLLEKQRRAALGASLLAVYGTWQCDGEVQRLVDLRTCSLADRQ